MISYSWLIKGIKMIENISIAQNITPQAHKQANYMLHGSIIKD